MVRFIVTKLFPMNVTIDELWPAVADLGVGDAAAPRFCGVFRPRGSKSSSLKRNVVVCCFLCHRRGHRTPSPVKKKCSSQIAMVARPLFIIQSSAFLRSYFWVKIAGMERFLGRGKQVFPSPRLNQ